MLAIVPVRGRNGKSRLGGFLGPDERAQVVQAMLADVLAACAAAPSLAGTIVVTPDPGIVPDGVETLADEGRGHGEAVTQALADSRAAGGAIVVMGDCPLVEPAVLERLVAAAAPIAIAPASDGGMNALVLREPARFAPAFGEDSAAAVTAERAHAAGQKPAIVEEASLAFDVDNPPDVWHLRDHERETRTRAVLAAILPPAGGLV